MWSEQGRAARGEGRAVCASPGWVAAGWTEQLPPRSADQAGGATAGAVGLADPCRDPGWAIPPSEHGHHRGSEQRTGTADLHLKGCFGRCVKSRRGLGVGGGRGQQREQTGERSRDSASSRARGTQGVQGAWRQPTDRRGCLPPWGAVWPRAATCAPRCGSTFRKRRSWHLVPSLHGK